MTEPTILHKDLTGSDLHDNKTNSSSDLYIDQNDQSYTERNAVFTISNNLASPTGIQANIYSLVQGKGDNTTFIGVSAGYFVAIDRTDVTTSNNGVLYAGQFAVQPRTNRDNVPYDDVACIVCQNDGTGQGTDCIYVGKGASVATDWVSIFTCEADANYFMNITGDYARGIDLHSATFSESDPMWIPNENWLCGSDAGGTVAIRMIGVSDQDEVSIADDAIFVARTTRRVAVGYTSGATLSYNFNVNGTMICTLIDVSLSYGLRVKSPGAGYLALSPSDSLSADRTLSIVMGNADRTLTLSGNPTISDWFDQSVKTTASPTFLSVSVGTYSAKAAEAFAGFLTLKDKDGTSRKVMVCA